ncbi:PHA/PHB synthase family protein [Alkalilacustris brevis]|uniref:PHA/PHB synthase family protein n=1 Tax=Alkalilacustris brevis TaxID=2026338 RepID=UPI000E0DF4E0|nr:alpha/beta fold hydrolase [Alkalilacustris brevis]
MAKRSDTTTPSRRQSASGRRARPAARKSVKKAAVASASPPKPQAKATPPKQGRTARSAKAEAAGAGRATRQTVLAAEAPVPPNGTAEAERRRGLSADPPEFCAMPGDEMPDAYGTRSMDRAYQAHLARFTAGITPFGLGATFAAWWIHLMGAPGKQLQLVEKAGRKTARLSAFAGQAWRNEACTPCIAPLSHDRRFDDKGWRQWPYNLIYQNFLMTQQWWYNATNDVPGLTPAQEKTVSFVSRQMLDMVSPANFIATNPEVLRTTIEQGGANLMRGAMNMIEDWDRAISRKPPLGAEDYLPGRDVAVTEGQVVYRSHLFELIQYAPKTGKVRPEPVLIVPAWIMKYYILDLSPQNSLIGYLVEQGYTVFAMSWRNPTAEDRELGMADYLGGLGKAMDAACAITGAGKLHAMGYCLGGTLLAAQAAAMGRDGDDRLASLTLLATQTDFSDPGELQLFVSESEVTFLENMMWDQGYLDTRQMAGAFQLLRSNDLIWSRYVHEYLMGRRQEMFDLMAWNADATRMPYRMHSEYLRRFYLDNELARGKYELGAAPVALSDIQAPIFCVSTLSDHVAPWQSVYKLHLLTDADLTFVLTKGGHNAGIISEPGRKGRDYRIHSRGRDDRYLSPEAWLDTAARHDGSWWPALVEWLDERSGAPVAPPAMGQESGPFHAREPAPGHYVMQR